MVAATIAVIYAGSARSEMREMHGLMCGSQKAMESVFAYGDANPDAPLQEALDAVTKADPDSGCGFKKAVVELGEVVGHVKHGSTEGELRKASVSAECSNGVCMFGINTTAFVVIETGPTL